MVDTHPALLVNCHRLTLLQYTSSKGIVNSVLHPVLYTLYPVPCTLYPVPCTLYLVPCTLYPVLYTLYPVPCTLYLVPCTLYPVLCTLYPVPCTLFRVWICILRLSLALSGENLDNVYWRTWILRRANHLVKSIQSI